jgi:hypothetical protein
MLIKFVSNKEMDVLLCNIKDDNFKNKADWEITAPRLRECLCKLSLKRFYVSPEFAGSPRIAIQVDEASISQHVLSSLIKCYKECPKSSEIAWRYEQGAWQGWVFFCSGDVYIEEDGYPWNLAALNEAANLG